MSQVRVMKRGKVYQYQFEIASQGGSRKYIRPVRQAIPFNMRIN